MTFRFRRWLMRKWLRRLDPSLAESYRVTFSGLHGERVLHHMIDSIYATTYEGTDPHAALVHNARRSVIQELLENLDQAEQPEKYRVQTDRMLEDIHAT